jgi:hypothetical protein
MILNPTHSSIISSLIVRVIIIKTHLGGPNALKLSPSPSPARASPPSQLQGISFAPQ